MSVRAVRNILSIWNLLLLLSAGATSASAAHFSAYSAFEPAPTGNIRVTVPTLAWRIVPGAGTRITAVHLTLNSVPVSAAYEPVRQSVLYTPALPLKPGAYSVHCSVTLDESFDVEKQWRFTIAPGAIDSIAAPDKSQLSVCERVNAVRRRLNLLPLTVDPRLCAAASSHSAYLAQNQNHAGHDQSTAMPGFIGERVADRVHMYGYAGGCYEAVSQGTIGPAAVDTLFDAPYHREQFLQPGTYEVGAGVNADVVTLLFGAAAESGVAVYPVDGQKDVPVSWSGIEQPNPMRAHPEWSGPMPVGYVISLYRFGKDSPRLTVSKATLSTADGVAVPMLVNSPANDDYLHNGVLILPQQKLRPGTIYRVNIVAASNLGDDCSRSWSFTTASSANTPLASSDK